MSPKPFLLILVTYPTPIMVFPAPIHDLFFYFFCNSDHRIKILKISGRTHGRIGRCDATRSKALFFCFFCNFSARHGAYNVSVCLSVIPPESLYEMPPDTSSSNQHISSVTWPGKTATTPRAWVFPDNEKLLRIGIPNRATYKEFVSKGMGSEVATGFCIDVFYVAVNFLPYPVPHYILYGDGHSNPNYYELVHMIALNANVHRNPVPWSQLCQWSLTQVSQNLRVKSAKHVQLLNNVLYTQREHN